MNLFTLTMCGFFFCDIFSSFVNLHLWIKLLKILNALCLFYGFVKPVSHQPWLLVRDQPCKWPVRTKITTRRAQIKHCNFQMSHRKNKLCSGPTCVFTVHMRVEEVYLFWCSLSERVCSLSLQQSYYWFPTDFSGSIQLWRGGVPCFEKRVIEESLGCGSCTTLLVPPGGELS